MRGDVVQRREATFVALDGDDTVRTLQKQRACQPTGARANLNDGDIFQRSGGPGDAPCQIEVE